MTLKVAIIGSGPAGFYTAEALLKHRPDAQIDIIDKLPTPFGLIRAGVAPDHQSIKAVTRRYEDTATGGDVAFFGNVEIGDGISIAALRGLYHAVVLATGAPADRKLGIPGDDLPGVYGAAQFVGWYNGHPDFAGLAPNLQDARAIVIGNGNVAVDVARVLTKTPAEMATSDLARHAAARIHGSPIEEVLIAGRRGPYQVSFTPKELGEMGVLERAVALADAAQFPDVSSDAALDGGLRKVVTSLRSFTAHRRAEKPVAIRFQFFLRPVAVLGTSKVEAMRFMKTRLEGDQAVDTGDTMDVACGLVIPCIGYRTKRIAGVPFDNDRGRFANDGGVIEPGLYCVGWARRGPTGTIGTNKPDGAMLAETIIAQCTDDERLGRTGLQQLITAQDLYVVSYQGWKAIEAAEVARANPGAPREKFADVDEMIKVTQS
jgi:NADPH-dependent glutamate synthase beta subunit-like oxidoreductase